VVHLPLGPIGFTGVAGVTRRCRAEQLNMSAANLVSTLAALARVGTIVTTRTGRQPRRTMVHGVRRKEAAHRIADGMASVALDTSNRNMRGCSHGLARSGQVATVAIVGRIGRMLVRRASPDRCAVMTTVALSW